MNLGKRIAAAVIAAATALTALSVSAFAADPVGTNPTTLKEGKQITERIAYVDSNDYDNGHNYTDFKFTAPADGVMILTFDAAIDQIAISTYTNKTKQTVEGDIEMKTGNYNNEWIGGSVGFNMNAICWNSDAGMSAGEISYKVTKGDYLIRISRNFNTGFFQRGNGTHGNGRIHISAEMKKPGAPGQIKVTEKTDTTAKFQWTEPDGCTSYDLRYKTGNGDWTTVKDIMDNNVTIKKLKGATKYTYQMRSHEGKIVGNWSKAASFKTNDPKNVKFDVPKVSSSVAVHITWGAVKNATGYKVQYSTNQKNWKTITVDTNSADIPVSSGKTYYYKVAAKNSSKTGSYSKVSSIKIG